jgi:hypothetical protein
MNNKELLEVAICYVKRMHLIEELAKEYNVELAIDDLLVNDWEIVKE